MATFAYNPGIQVYIEVTDKDTQTTRILDVSDDLTVGQLTRRSDGISQFQFTLQNPARKYTYDTVKNEPKPVFMPMDRIIVNMKRLKWMRVFTGYLDSVPVFQAWPGEVNLQASCSLKRLQYWFWDSTIAASEQLVRNSLFADIKTAQDGGTANVLLSILQNVVNWPPEKAHIGAIPSDWYDFAADIVASLVKDVDAANAAAQAVAQATGGTSTVGGVKTTVNVAGVLSPGKYANWTLDKEQCVNAEIIFTVGKSLGASDEQCAMGIACSMDESHLRNITYGDRDSVGLFQQRPSQGWGTIQQCEDPQHAATQFFTRLLHDYSTQKSFGMNIQTVQISATLDGSNYAACQAAAEAVTKALVASEGTTAMAQDPTVGRRIVNADGTPNTAAGPNGGVAVAKPGQVDQNTFLQTALGLVTTNPSIPYALGGDSPPTVANPSRLDCSSFMQWVYYHAMGSLHGMPRVANAQAAWCAANGGKRLTVQQAANTPGAVLYMSSNGTLSGVEHTELSCGDGTHTVGAHHTGTVAGVVSGATSFSFGYTLPHVAYSNIGGGGGVTVGTDGSTTVQSNQANTDPNAPTTDVSGKSKDPIDRLFNGLAWSPNDTSGAATLSNSLFGIRALLNDEPLLPYLINLMRCSMRSLCSAPNGDFMAWFPDYYGIWGTAAVMIIQDIELVNFSMDWSDLEMVTHEFVTQAITSQFNINDGTLTNTGQDPTLFTTGIASIDVGQIMSALFGIAPTAKDEAVFKEFIYQRFGARVDYQALQGISGPKGEFFMALFLFMQNWAKQYTATMPTTFMPELWPGMLAQLPSFNFQAYINTVTHSFKMGEGGYFNTEAEIIAPSRLDGTNPLNYGLPLAGNFGPGRTFNSKNDVAPKTKPPALPDPKGGPTRRKTGS